MRKWAAVLLGLVFAAVVGITIPPAGASPPRYEVVAIQDGGRLSATATVASDVVPPGDHTPAAEFQSHCGATVVNEAVVARDGRLANVAMWLDIQRGKEPSRDPVRLTNQACRFVPHVVTTTEGNTLVMENADSFLHNVHLTMDRGLTLANIAIPSGAPAVQRPMRQAGIIRVTCDVHGWMRAYVHVLPHPYHGVTGETGECALADIPPGSYTLRAWHETLRVQEQTVEIRSGQETTVAITFARQG